MSPHHDTLGIASLDDILKQYGANPDLLQLILVSKVQEDRRRAEEARLRSKEIDFCIQKDTMKLPSIVHFDKSSTTTCPPADETPQSPPSHRSSSSTTTSSLGSPRSLPEQRPDPIFAPTKLPQLHHILEPQSTPRFVADRRLPTIPPAPPFGHNIPYPLVTRSSTQPSYGAATEKNSSPPPLFHPTPQHFQQSATDSLKEKNSPSSSSNNLQKRPCPDEEPSTASSSSQPSAQSVSSIPHKLPLPPHPYYSSDSRKRQDDLQRSRTKRRRREMQPITMIIETREFPYNDEYLWKNNGNTVHRTSGNRSIYYKCANNNKGCHVNKTVTFKDNGEYLIKYRGNHLPDCKRIKRVVDI